jgi:hypothetical protein
MSTSNLGLTVIENRLRQAFGGVVPFVGIMSFRPTHFHCDGWMLKECSVLCSNCCPGNYDEPFFSSAKSAGSNIRSEAEKAYRQQPVLWGQWLPPVLKRVHSESPTYPTEL